MNSEPIRLTQYSHGAGCGCKISPATLDRILRECGDPGSFPGLLVGNSSRDDAAVFDLGQGRALVSTTDFFMPIVDDPYDFGRIAAANALSDIYAMGASPMLAIAILGWPVSVLDPGIAGLVVRGGQSICSEAGIPLAGGHSIDCPEPVFGLAVTGMVSHGHLKRNDKAMPGDWIYLTKALGVGILTTAEKKNILDPAHRGLAALQMMRLNRIGPLLGAQPEISAMTDVTGFGLLGHLREMTRGSGTSAELWFDQIPLILPDLRDYILGQAIPGGMQRNWDSYGQDMGPMPEYYRVILSDPQTSGGLLFSVRPEGRLKIEELLRSSGQEDFAQPIGRMTLARERSIYLL